MTLLTDSAALVGAVQTMWAVPGFLLALHAGAIADLFDRRKVVLITHVAALAIAFSVAVLQWTDRLTPAVLLGGTFLESIALTVAGPAFIALTPQVVDAPRLRQAMALDATARNVAQTVGPALAGAVIAISGAGTVYVFNALAFIWIIVLARSGRLPVLEQVNTTGINAAIKEGIAHVIGQAPLRNTAIRLTFANIAIAAVVALLPLAAKRNIGLNASGFGLLYAALGAGSVVMVFFLPSLRRLLSEESLAMLATGVWAIGVVCFAFATTMPLALVTMFISGLGLMALMNVLFTTLISGLADWVRGRGAALAILSAWLGTSIGALMWGIVAGATSVTTALITAAIAGVSVSAVGRLVLPISH
jgi:MFS family permease